MSKKHRQSTLDALNKYYQNQLPKEPTEGPARAPNKAPEKEVEKACLTWMRARGWSVEIFESKATYSPRAGRYIQQSMKAGVCDCMGSDDLGLGVAIEFKAPGKLSSFNREGNFNQRNFIVGKINANCFACVVDSVSRLETIYLRWVELRSDMGSARNYLLSMLPAVSEKTKLKDGRLFDED